MHVAFTARKGKISKAVRTQAEEGMERIGRVLGRAARASVHVQRARHSPSSPRARRARRILPPRARATPPMRRCARPSIPPEHQAPSHLFYPPRAMPSLRGKSNDRSSPLRGPRRTWNPPTKIRRDPRRTVGIGVFFLHSFSCAPHGCGAAHRQERRGHCAAGPMTIEEAVKDAEFRDRDLLIFDVLRWGTRLCCVAAATARWSWSRSFERGLRRAVARLIKRPRMRTFLLPPARYPRFMRPGRPSGVIANPPSCRIFILPLCVRPDFGCIG